MSNAEFLFRSVERLAAQMQQDGEPGGPAGSKIHMNPDDYLDFKNYFDRREDPAQSLSEDEMLSHFGYEIVADEMVPRSKVEARQLRK